MPTILIYILKKESIIVLLGVQQDIGLYIYIYSYVVLDIVQILESKSRLACLSKYIDYSPLAIIAIITSCLYVYSQASRSSCEYNYIYIQQVVAYSYSTASKEYTLIILLKRCQRQATILYSIIIRLGLRKSYVY